MSSLRYRLIVAATVLYLSAFANAVGFLDAPVYMTGDAPIWVAIADFNRDGHPDVAAANFVGGNVSILLNNGDGTFAAPVNYPSGSLPIFILAGDFNNDSNPDLIVIGQDNNSVAILLGNGDGSFQPMSQVFA